MSFGHPHDRRPDDLTLCDALQSAFVQREHLGVLIVGVTVVVEIGTNEAGYCLRGFRGRGLRILRDIGHG